MFALHRTVIITVLAMILFSCETFSQWDVIKDLVEKEIEKEVTNYALKEVRLFNPYREGNTSLDQLVNDILEVSGYDLRNEPLRIKVYKIVEGNILQNIKFIKFNSDWVSIKDIYAQFSNSDIVQNYRLVQEAANRKSDTDLAVSLTLLMSSISNFQK